MVELDNGANELPIVLPEIIEPAVADKTEIPLKYAFPVPVPITEIPPIWLFLITMLAVLPVPAKIPEKAAPAEDILKEILPVADKLPIRFGIVSPQ